MYLPTLIVVSEGEIKSIYKRFRKLDREEKGYVSAAEFSTIPELERNPLNQRICQVLCKDADKIDFVDFVKALSTFNSRGDAESEAAFMFKVYDINGDGYVTQEEMMSIFKLLTGTNLSATQLQQIVEKTLKDLDVDRDGKLNYEEFKKVSLGLLYRSLHFPLIINCIQ